MSALDRISVEPSRRCTKGCAFCYNGSGPSGGGDWTATAMIEFVSDCAKNGVQAVSFGGGEPLEWAGLFECLEALQGRLFRSLTTNGLPLEDPAILRALLRSPPEKIHVSVHAPERPGEVDRALRWTAALSEHGVRTGVNLLVRRSRLPEARAAAARLRHLGPARLILLPLKGPGDDRPTPAELASVVPGPFQSMSCLNACGKSPRFASIAADQTAAWCSYTTTRAPLRSLDFAGLVGALDGLGLRPCSEALVRE